MHFGDPILQRSPRRSKLSATLLRLNRNLEANWQRDLLAQKVFEDWEARSAGQHEAITRQLDSLTEELLHLSASIRPARQLSLLSESTYDEDGPQADNTDETTESRREDDEEGIISLPNTPWHRA